MTDISEARDTDEVPDPDAPSSAGEKNAEVSKAFSETATNEEKLDMVIDAIAILGDDELGKALHDNFIIRRNSARTIRTFNEDGSPRTADEAAREEFEKRLAEDGVKATESAESGDDDAELEPTVGDPGAAAAGDSTVNPENPGNPADQVGGDQV